MQKESKQANPAKPRSAGRGQESIFDIAIEMLLIAVVFLAPVIFDRRVGIVFSLTKVTVVRIILIAILTIWAVKIMLKQEHKFIRSPLDYPILSYFLVCTVAMLTSVHVLTSFMGFYGRYEGCSTLYMYCLLFFITTNFIRSKEQILRVMYTVIIAGVCMAVYGVIQRMGLDPYAWGGVITWQRVIGTIGQPNFLAAYVDMAFIIGLALLLNMKEIRWSRQFQWQTAYDVILRAVLVISLFLIYVCVLYTQSRGGFLGLFVGVALFFTCVNRNLTIDKWKELSVLFLLIAVITVITSLNPETSPFGRFASEAAKTGEMSASETTITTYNATLSRIETWKSAYKIIADRPVFGIGQEVLKMVFPRYETNKFRFYEGFHVKQDRCHNEVCDMAVTRGVTGLAVYVWVLATFFYMGFKLIRGDFDPELKLFTAGFMGASAAYLVQNQFSFGVVAITTLLWVMMGLTTSIYVKSQEPETAKSVDFSNMPWLLFAAVLILALFLTYLSTIQFRADMHYKSGNTLTDMRRFDYAVKEYETSLKISPYEGGTWTHYGLATLNIALMTRDMRYIDQSLGIFDIAAKVDPYNADNFFITGKIRFNEVHPNDNSSLDKIIDIEKNALKIDPLYAEAYQIIGAVYEREGKNRDAAQMYEKAVEINPQLSDAVSGLANIYIRLNEPRKIIDIFKGFLVKYPNNAVFQENLAAIYVKTGETGQAVKIYEEMVAANPKNFNALVNLGFMSARIGKMAEAKDSFERAYLIDPKNVNVHNGLGLVHLSTGSKEKAREEFNQTLMVDPNNQYAKDMLGRMK
jgi:tetratricopeptide (TPR) repeat protein/O-antigen ligase